MSISFCIPTYNRLPHLKRLLDSIFDGFNDYPYEVIVADGGSTDGTLEYLRGLDNVTLIEQGKLTGSVKAFNACFKIAKCDYIFWPADDFVLMPDVLIKSCKLMDRYKEIGAVCPKIQETIFGNFPGVAPVKYMVVSKTHIFRASVLRDINYFDEAFRTYYVDGDSFRSVLKLGYTFIFTREVGAIHNRVQDENWALNLKTMEDPREEAYYQKKWAGFRSALNQHMRSSPIKKYRSLFFMLVCDRIFSRKVMRSAGVRNNRLLIRLYDWLLEQCVTIQAKEYSHLKDFYLAQKLPKEVMSSIK